MWGKNTALCMICVHMDVIGRVKKAFLIVTACLCEPQRLHALAVKKFSLI
jgi:hypothetical protein